MSKNYTHCNGFVALLSTIIIGAVLLLITVSAGQSGWYTRFIVLGTEAKQQSRMFASGCIQEALAKLLIEPNWVGDATSTYSEGTCHIHPIQSDFSLSPLVTIQASGEVRGAMTNIVSTFNMQDINMTGVPEAVPATPPQTSNNILPTEESYLEVEVMP